jgi:hypothetical protein
MNTQKNSNSQYSVPQILVIRALGGIPAGYSDWLKPVLP